jgi:hypothetical protein
MYSSKKSIFGIFAGWLIVGGSWFVALWWDSMAHKITDCGAFGIGCLMQSLMGLFISHGVATVILWFNLGVLAAGNKFRYMTIALAGFTSLVFLVLLIFFTPYFLR